MYSDIEIDRAILERTNPVFNTAKMTLFQLATSGDRDAAAISQRLGLTLEETQSSASGSATPEQLLTNEIMMDLRFHTASCLSERSGCPVHVDLPCGYTPRALQFARKGLRFVGLDLPAAVSEAEPAILSLIDPEHRDLVRFAGVDATNYESLAQALDGETGELCITTEGLLMYFTDSETGVLLDNIRRLLQKHGGVWITVDPETSLIYLAIMKTIAGDRFMEMIMSGKRRAEDKSDITMGTMTMMISPQNTAEGMARAKAFLAEHGLKAERLILSEHMPRLATLAKLPPEQAETIRSGIRNCAIWKITVADNARPLDTAEVDANGFHVSAELDAGTLKLTLAGRLDTITAPNLLAFYEKQKDGIRSVHVHCEELEYISSAGLRVLLIMQKGSAEGLTLYHIRPAVREILEQTGFDSILTLSD
ncbi:MAG: STAS domain-containing protein [Clostridia bacterium]|nr:STAS domain-containing protein [Clostridia bacterium]